MMKNSMVLKIAVVLCGMNTFFTFLSTWSSSSYKARLRDAQAATVESSKAIQELQRKLENQETKLDVELEELRREVRSSSRIFDEILELPSVSPRSNPLKQNGF
jgi:uncharacterized protein YlxW (UPF0749 family)